MALTTDKTANTKMLTQTTLAPVGASYFMERIKPARKQKVEIISEEQTTFLKLLQILIEDTVGKIIREEIKI